ncbi:hypothetical protein M0654_09045 [Rhizobium sp. NTR19]|uniref:GTPase n=1 Tax=Neorhizobium turbinariae TaxID=2937795 RepID=A0ABT0IQH7_9HYPH|nr:hypothetical protein [Neorhizobium turbinariae]MCK8780128.1 hypothetical protein [Neorhizobium turbinariae]
MSAMLARYLRDFSEPEAPPPDMMGAAFDHGTDDDLHFEVPAAPLVDLEAERAEAHQQGYQEASETLRREFEEERQALVAAHAAELAGLREQYENQAAATIASRLEEIAAVTAQAVSDQTAAILAPLVDEALAAQAVGEMAALIRAAILDGDAGVLTVRGPVHLFEKLQEALGAENTALRHIEAPDLDISVDIGETALVTRISAWSASLKKVMK